MTQQDDRQEEEERNEAESEHDDLVVLLVDLADHKHLARSSVLLRSRLQSEACAPGAGILVLAQSPNGKPGTRCEPTIITNAENFEVACAVRRALRLGDITDRPWAVCGNGSLAQTRACVVGVCRRLSRATRSKNQKDLCFRWSSDSLAV